jgi:MFS family permease
MRALLIATWPLLLSVAFMMIGNGLQSTLLGIRATLEGFATPLIGLVMTGYYTGFLLGSYQIPRIIGRVGHIRAFAALCALGSIAILVHALAVNWPTWTAMRMLTGFCFAGLYIVCESWLNDRSTNETRGQLLSIYMVVQYGAATAAQIAFMVELASPAGFELFALVALVMSAAVVPVALTPIPTPAFERPTHIGLAALYRASPLGVIGMLGVGLSLSVFASMSAVYAKSLGFSDTVVALFVMIGILGGTVSQWPVGRLSDRMPRRAVITIVTLAAAVITAAAAMLPGMSQLTLFAVAFLFGSLSLPMYSLCVAHTNDFLRPEQMVAASGGIILVFGIGAIGGPVTVGLVMRAIGPDGFFIFLALIHTAVGLFAIYRMFRRPAPEERSPFIPATPGAVSPAALAPAGGDGPPARARD